LNNKWLKGQISYILMTTQQTINVFITGDKTGFNSKTAIDNFKSFVKTNKNFDINVLGQRFVKPDYHIELIESTETSLKFMVDKVATPNQTVDHRRQLLQAKLTMMKQDRTNSVYHKAKTNPNVPNEILTEYMKLKKISKMPIPEPNEIFARPDEYKPIIQMVLTNNLMKQLGSAHPYVKYFRLIAEKLGVTEPLPIPTASTDGVESNADMFANLQTGAMSKDNDDTDSDEEPTTN